MEWNTKWDWENIISFGSKASESPKKQQQLTMDWMLVVDDDDDDNDDDGEINPGPLFNLSDGGGHNSSAKSSISASTDSSTHTPSFRLTTFESASPSYLGSGEPLIGLKLGKRTYFENTIKSSTTSFTVMPTPSSSTTLKKNKSSSAQNAPICCQVEGCISDLSQAKEYHRKHKVCDTHSKCPKVIVGGVERRFCQQCSRFHSLCEFDEKKRSCRRRLSHHNARRRKPQQETIQFSSARLSSPFYGGTQQMGFLLNNSDSTTPANSMWDDSICNSKFTLTNKGYPLKSNGDGSSDDQEFHIVPGIKVPPRAINLQNGANASKNSMSQVFNPTDAAPDGALSLLSSNSWDSCEPDQSIPLHHVMHGNDSNNISQPMIHAVPEGVPLSSSEFWLSGHQSMHPYLVRSGFLL